MENNLHLIKVVLIIRNSFFIDKIYLKCYTKNEGDTNLFKGEERMDINTILPILSSVIAIISLLMATKKNNTNDGYFVGKVETKLVKEYHS